MKSKRMNWLWPKESKNLMERLEKLYGPGSYANLMETVMSKSRRMSVFLLGLFLIVVIMSVIRSNTDNKWISFDENGYLASITRPTTGSDKVIVEAEVISETGEQLSPQGVKLVVAPQSGKALNLDASAAQSDEGAEDLLQHEIRKTVYEINNNNDSKQVMLPDRLSDGTRIHWVPEKKRSGFLLATILVMACLFVYRSRDAELVRAERMSRESVLRDLPEFVNKLVLLLNAGLVMPIAFQKIVTEHNKRTEGLNDYFYEQMNQIMVKCKETNSSVQIEIRHFAVRTGIVEFMRLSNLITDSMTKGSDLITQLRMEGDSLWVARRKQMEEKGKIAESKLTFPMMILLLVLVLITIAPAMMEMK